jgi:hypothetical protein
LIPDHFEQAFGLSHALDALLAGLDTDPGDTDVIVDFGAVGSGTAGLLTMNIRNVLGLLPRLTDWRSVTVASAAFPDTLGGLTVDNWSMIPRMEWIAWRAAITGITGLPRQPWYGDYAIGTPNLPTSQHPGPASLRYSSGDDYFIWRGILPRKHPLGNGQMFGICADLVGRPQFAGLDFSQGDAEIQQRATSQDSPGGPTEWRQWATNHYLELVASQLASLSGP